MQDMLMTLKMVTVLFLLFLLVRWLVLSVLFRKHRGRRGWREAGSGSEISRTGEIPVVAADETIRVWLEVEGAEEIKEAYATFATFGSDHMLGNFISLTSSEEPAADGFVCLEGGSKDKPGGEYRIIWLTLIGVDDRKLPAGEVPDVRFWIEKSNSPPRRITGWSVVGEPEAPGEGPSGSGDGVRTRSRSS